MPSEQEGARYQPNGFERHAALSIKLSFDRDARPRVQKLQQPVYCACTGCFLTTDNNLKNLQILIQAYFRCRNQFISYLTISGSQRREQLCR
jgi:hypothetical protein